MASDYGETLQGLASLVNAFGNLMEPSEAELRREERGFQAKQFEASQKSEAELRREERDFQAKQFEASQKFALYQGQANRIQNQITSTETVMMNQWGSLPPVDKTDGMQSLTEEINSGNYSALETVQKQAELARLELNRLNFANATVQGLRQFERNLVSQYPEIAGSDFDLNSDKEWDNMYGTLSANGAFVHNGVTIETLGQWRENMEAYYNPSTNLEKFVQNVPLFNLQEMVSVNAIRNAQKEMQRADELFPLQKEALKTQADTAKLDLFMQVLNLYKGQLDEATDQASSILTVNAGKVGTFSLAQMVAYENATLKSETAEAATEKLDEIYKELLDNGVMTLDQLMDFQTAVRAAAGGNKAMLQGLIFDTTFGEGSKWNSSIRVNGGGNRGIILESVRQAFIKHTRHNNSYNPEMGFNEEVGELSALPYELRVKQSMKEVQANKVNYTKKNPNTLTLQNGTILNFDTGEAYDPLFNKVTKPSATEWNSLLQNDLNNNKNANYQGYFKEISPVATANDPFAKENSKYQKFLSGGFDGVLPNMDMLFIVQTAILDPRIKGFNKRVKAFGETTYEELENQIANMSFRDIADGLEMNKFILFWRGNIPTIGGLRSNLEHTLAKKLNTGGKWFPTYRGLSDEKKALVDGVVDKLIEKYERTVTRFWNGIDDPATKRLVVDMVGRAQSNFSADERMRELNDELNAKKSAEFNWIDPVGEDWEAAMGEEPESKYNTLPYEGGDHRAPTKAGMEALLRALEEKSQQDGNYTPPKKTKQESENEDRQLPVRPQGKTLGATQTNPQNTNIAEYLSIFNKNLTQRV